MFMAKKKNNNYFTQETEDAIIRYNNTDDTILKSKIYEQYINYPFFKLTQNIIHTFKFYHTEVENIEDLQHEIMIFLLEKIHLYNHAQNIQDRIRKILVREHNLEYNYDFVKYVDYALKVNQQQIDNFIEFLQSQISLSDEILSKLKVLTPPKAYSYFGTIVKRWLILYNEKNYKNKIVSSPVTILEEDKNYSYSLDDSKEVLLSNNDKISLFMDLYVEYCTSNIYSLFPKELDAKIADSILELFRMRDKLEIFNKKALYIYVKEMIDVKTPKITKIADKLYDIFKYNYIFYLEHGYIKFQNV